MAKIGLTKLGLKKNTDLLEVHWNDQIIELHKYLPVEDKRELVQRIVDLSLNDDNFANPMLIEINIVLECAFTYITNVTFTEKQKEDRLGLYDLLIGTGFWEEIVKVMNENTNEFYTITKSVREVIDEVYRYKNSAMGILDIISTDYSNLNFDVSNIQNTLENPENLGLLKDVVTKLG